MLDAPVLVLNQNYEPLNVCDIRRAFNLLGSEKAELLERNHQIIHTPTLAIPAPSVIRLVYLVRRPRPRVKLSRREVFARDELGPARPSTAMPVCGTHAAITEPATGQSQLAY